MFRSQRISTFQWCPAIFHPSHVAAVLRALKFSLPWQSFFSCSRYSRFSFPSLLLSLCYIDSLSLCRTASPPESSSSGVPRGQFLPQTFPPRVPIGYTMLNKVRPLYNLILTSSNALGSAPVCAGRLGITTTMSRWKVFRTYVYLSHQWLYALQVQSWSWKRKSETICVTYLALSFCCKSLFLAFFFRSFFGLLASYVLSLSQTSNSTCS